MPSLGGRYLQNNLGAVVSMLTQLWEDLSAVVVGIGSAKPLPNH